MTNSQGLSYIGYFIWWQVSDQRIKQADLQALIEKVGILDADGKPFKVHEVLARSAFLKAVREVRGKYKNRGLLIQKIRKSSDEYVFGLVDEEVNEREQTLDYSHAATMKFHPDSGRLFCNSPHRAFDLVKERYEEYTGYFNSDDVRDIILRIVRSSHAVSVRQRGGFYFVPEAQRDLVDKLEALVGALPGGDAMDLTKVGSGSANGSYLAIAPQVDEDRSKKAIYKAFMSSLHYRMNSFEKDLDEDGLTQTHALRTRLDEFAEMKKEILFYSTAMQFEVEGVTDRLAGLTGKLTDKLTAKAS